MNPRDYPWHERLLPERERGNVYTIYNVWWIMVYAYGNACFPLPLYRRLHNPLFLPRLLLLHLLFHLVIPQNEAAARGDDAAMVNQAGSHEIAGGLCPEDIPFVADARQVCSHVVDL